jgi:hypothetical protein
MLLLLRRRCRQLERQQQLLMLPVGWWCWCFQQPLSWCAWAAAGAAHHKGHRVGRGGGVQETAAAAIVRCWLMHT